jgi:two-component system NtrC family sensor kinase
MTMNPDTAAVALLSEVDIFKDTPEAEIRELAAHFRRRDASEGELIIRKGDEGNSIYIIGSGSVKVHDGDQVVAVLNTRSFFGEISLLDDAPRSMSVSALEPTTLYWMSREDFYRLFRDQPEVTQRIVSTLTRRLRNQNEATIRQLRMREEELSALVEERTAELREKNIELEDTLANLKATQQQLIQQEKLASLGQLTSGIAHELQNPLNFVTNFSSLSSELVEEILAASEEDERREVGELIRQNLEKISHHSKRAGNIVKGMLEHTRSGKGEKTESDISQLCDRLSDLALKTMQAATPGFECELVKEWDPSLPRIEVIPQELSRVVINLLNNAFYAVKDTPGARVEISTQPASPGPDGQPRIAIRVCDNGTGIPEGILQKIFDPFFTTKPTGFGNTGLGLSIAFDIVQAHGGEIQAESKEGEGSVFQVILPAGE